MLIMPANSNKALMMYLQGVTGLLGHLYSPGGQRGPYPFVPYALDNGAFAAWSRGTRFDRDAWLKLLDWAAKQCQKPLFALVPDKVQDKETTLEWYDHYRHEVTDRGFNVGFVLQDGMETLSDVELAQLDAHTLFLGGSDGWRWHHGPRFSQSLYKKHFHIGRINSYQGLQRCKWLRADSCDGTGWFRGDRKQLAGLIQFLAEESGKSLNGITLTSHLTGTKKNSSANPLMALRLFQD